MPEDERSSLDVILTEAHRVLDHQLRLFDALDTRAGIVLGFAGTLVALASGTSILVSIGRGLAATCALVALLGFVSPSMFALNEEVLQSNFMEQGVREAKLGLIALHAESFRLAERSIRSKKRRLRTAIALLVIAVFFVAAGGGR